MRWLYLILLLCLLIPISGQESWWGWIDETTTTNSAHPYAPGVVVEVMDAFGGSWRTVAKLDGLELIGDDRPPILRTLSAVPDYLLYRPVEHTKVFKLHRPAAVLMVFVGKDFLVEGPGYWRSKEDEITLHSAVSDIPVAIYAW